MTCKNDNNIINVCISIYTEAEALILNIRDKMCNAWLAYGTPYFMKKVNLGIEITYNTGP